MNRSTGVPPVRYLGETPKPRKVAQAFLPVDYMGKMPKPRARYNPSRPNGQNGG